MGGGVYCCSAMSVFIPCFLKLFEVMGAFLWEIKSITARSERQGRATAGPFRLRAEKLVVLQMMRGSTILLIFHFNSTFFLLGLQLKSTKTFRINKACFLQTAFALTMWLNELDVC